MGDTRSSKTCDATVQDVLRKSSQFKSTQVNSSQLTSTQVHFHGHASMPLNTPKKRCPLRFATGSPGPLAGEATSSWKVAQAVRASRWKQNAMMPMGSSVETVGKWWFNGGLMGFYGGLMVV